MMTIEEYKNTFNRLCSEYDYKHAHCYGCFLEHYCTEHPVNTIGSVIELLERLEIWAAENPIKTNRDKFEEVFGYKVKTNDGEGPHCGGNIYKECISAGMLPCHSCTWWDEEYIEQKQE